MKNTVRTTGITQFVPGNGVVSAEIYPLTGRNQHATRWQRVTRKTIRNGWEVAGIVISGNLAPIGSVIVIGPNRYWYAI